MRGELSRYLAAYQRQTEFECIHFALGGAVAAGRRDLRHLLPRVTTLIGAKRALQRRGFSALFEAMDAHAKPIASARALPGDVAYLDVAPIGALGVVIGPEAVFLQQGGGYFRTSIASRWVWRIE